MNLMFFSLLVGKSILDRNGEKIASLKDLIVRINPIVGKSEEKYPPLAGILAHSNSREFWIPASQVQEFEQGKIRLHDAKVSLERFERRDGEILLYKDVLDKQLVDVEGRRVIRVNDLALGNAPNELTPRLVGVDISFQALVRRILPFGGTPRVSRLSRNENLLDWADVEYFASSAPSVRLNVSHARLAKMHPVDIARLLDELSYVQGAEIVNALDDETAADALEEMNPDYAADILEGLSEDRAADILEEMQPDDAADVIADLDENKAQALLELMEEEESEEVRELLAYDEDAAGGIMTNDFLMLPDNLGASEALQTIRELETQPEFVDYIYVVEPDSEKLVGVAALRDVVFCQPRTTLLSELIVRNYISMKTDSKAEDAAAVLADYGFRALPVLNEEGEIKGIITFDDALDLILPEDLRRRLPNIFKNHRGMVSFVKK
ncbi:MAG: magnesium transporter [Chloroflexi bacterium]|uniref:CBS domain-containing protein n=1 Tax=Candidatus Chlorohelix allophototropha TaxID=3003348 RepID=A0A8T7M042_9CHLR|nr:magnesium transporter [Chloroflexota bacterium]WJW66550.1 CBS domain-containing protein [Chloroflexota bacterium L227-S17]